MKTYYWLIKREFWEHRGSFLWAPVIATGIFLLLNVMGIITFEVFAARHGININGLNLDQLVHSMNAHDLAKIGIGIDMAMMSSSSLIGIVLGIVVFFYCLGSLYDDRRDRSILFWKSLPISDRDTVISKALAATVLAPVIATICGLIGAVIMLLLVMLVAAIHGVGLWSLLGYAHPLRSLFTLVAIIPVNLVWALPAVGWLMLCSAWARSKPFLWAVAIPVGAGIIVSWLKFLGIAGISGAWFWRDVVTRVLLSVFPSGWIGNDSFIVSGDRMQGMHFPEHLQRLASIGHAWGQLARPEFIIGAVAGVAMIAAAIWFRRTRTET